MTAILSPFGSSSATSGPWQFTLEQFGAKGDGRVFGDLGITSGTGVLSSSSVNASSGDVGKWVVVNGGLSGSLPLIAQVTGTSGNNWTLGTNATATVTAGTGSGFMATDDQPAMLKAAQAMQTYALASDYKCQLILQAKLYGAHALYQSSTAAGIWNTHLPVFTPNINGSTQKLLWEIIGPGHAGNLQFWESTVPNIQGAAIVSMNQAPSTADPTFGQQSIIGGPTGGGVFTGGVANTHLHTAGFMVAAPAFPQQIGLDAYFLTCWSWDSFSANVIQSVIGNAPALPSMPGSGGFQSSIGKGIKAPLLGNNDDVTGVRLAVEGYETGLVVSDHFTCDGLATLYTDLAVLVDVANSPLGNKAHKVTIANWSNEVYNGALRCNGGGGTYADINISLDTETSGNVNPTYDVNDAGNALFGVLTWSDPFRTSGVPVVSGAANLRVINDRLGPGHMGSPPAVPATTVASVPVYRDAFVTIHTGVGVTVSAIAIGGTATGLTMAASSTVQISVPTGQTVTLTYAGGTPTWDWWTF